jgi:two-component system response regulator LytT
MKHQPKTNIIPGSYRLPALDTREIDAAFKKTKGSANFFQQFPALNLNDLLANLACSVGKKSFLVFKNNKYINVLTENIVLFYVKYESTIIMDFTMQEYFVNYSLEQVQSLLPDTQFFRLNRQYLINFNAIKEAEHYFARKLLVSLVIPTKEKLLVSKEKVRYFLNWLDNR